MEPRFPDAGLDLGEAAIGRAAVKPTALFQRAKHLWRLVPAGGTLPEDVWNNRHRFLLGLTWFHAVIIAVSGSVFGYSWDPSLAALFHRETVLHTFGEGLIVAFFAALAARPKASRTFKATAVGFGLMTSSAILVHLSGGYIELHFHFFVMLVFLALYQDWVPYLLAILYVAVHHGLVGGLWPEAVYNHAAAFRAPWTWAGIHAFFVLSACVGSVIAWRFNELAFARTRRAEEAMHQLNIELERRVIERTAQLEAANKVKDEFLGVMSHELRTPLTVMMGYTSMIKDRLLGEINSAQETALEKVIRQGRGQLTMITGILQVTQLEAGGTQAILQEFRLKDFLDDLRSSYAIPLGKEIAIAWDYPSDLPVLKTDQLKLKQILENLIHNAIKFTDMGTVTVSAGLVDRAEPARRVQFKVVDTGIGIAKDFIPLIFERFRQVDSSETRPHGGVGLGLHIVEKFTSLLGGRIEVESELGKGSTFTVTLPIVSG
jgi:signal transduction histidine kinase